MSSSGVRALHTVKKTKLLVIDDDANLSHAIELFFTKVGYQVVAAHDGAEGLQQFYRHQPDLVLLDVMLPKMDGWDALRRMRELADTPIIMLTARGQEADKINGLKMGADDYVAKPFSLRELEARVEAVLRRARAPGAPPPGPLFNDGNLVIDSVGWEVRRDGQPLELTATERRLLFFLAEHAGQALTPTQILQAVWGPQYSEEADYVKLYIWRLRQKIEDDPAQPRYILTERGIGYRFSRP